MRLQILMCLICFIPTYSNGAVQIRVGLELAETPPLFFDSRDLFLTLTSTALQKTFVDFSSNLPADLALKNGGDFW